MAFSSLSPLPMKSLDISRSSSSISRSPYHFARYPLRRLQLNSRSNQEIRDSSNPREGCCSSAESNKWKRILSAAMAAAVIASSSGVPAMAELNKFEADTRGEFGIGSAAQFGSADLSKTVHSNENFRRANFTSADMRGSDFSGSTFNGAYMEKAVAYKANFSGADLSDTLMDRMVKTIHREATSFWFDRWSDLGCLMDTIGPHGVIDMGIPLQATVAQAWTLRRRRRHRAGNLRQVEAVLETQKQRSTPGATDIPMWRSKHDRFRPQFQSKRTWSLLREAAPLAPWYNGVWFRHSTPKYSLFTWLAIHNRLTTGDRMLMWNVGASSSCVFCGHTVESIPHLFFVCSYSKEIWRKLAHGLLHNRYTVYWNMIIPLLSDTTLDKKTLFLFRYLFQATLHTIWRERNARRHGDVPTPALQLIRFLDKQVRNRASSVPDDQGCRPLLQTWFASRSI